MDVVWRLLGTKPKPLLSRVIMPGVSDIVERLRILFIWVGCGLGGNWVLGVRVAGGAILDGGVGGILNCYLARSINSVNVF